LSGIVRDDGEAVYAAAVRALSFEEKLRASEVLRDAAWEMAAAAVRRAHPEWPESDVVQQVREVFLRGSA
jgi:hypothetical protein